MILDDGSSIHGEVLDGPKDSTLLRVAVLRGKDRVVVEIPRATIRFVRQLNTLEERLSAKGSEALVAGRLSIAIELYGQLVKRRPTDSRVHRELGFALLLANRAKEALAPLQEACALDPLDLEAHMELAQAHEGLGQVDPAADAYRKATRIGPKHVTAWRALAQLLLIRGTAESQREALDCLRRAAQADPTSEDVVLEWASAILGKDPKEARNILTAFATRLPSAARVGRALAKLDAVAGEYKLAGDRLARLVARGLKAPVGELIEAELALYRWLQDPGKAPSPAGTDASTLSAAALDAADRRLGILLDALPDDARLQLAVARLRLRTGRYGESRSWLEQAALDGSAEVAEDALLLQEVALTLQRAALVPGVSTPTALLGPSPSLPRARRLVRLVPWLEASYGTLGGVLEARGEFDHAGDVYVDGAKTVRDEPASRRLQEAARSARLKAAEQRRNKGT